MCDELEKSLQWKTKPEPPLPSFYKMEMKIEKNTTDHDSSLDDDFKNVYTNPIDVMNIDVVEEILNFKTSSSKFLRETDVMDQKYFSLKNERNEVFKRFEQQSKIKNIFDFKSHLENSFVTVDEEEEDVIESYPLFPSNNNNNNIKQTQTKTYKTDLNDKTKIYKAVDSNKAVDLNINNDFLFIAGASELEFSKFEILEKYPGRFKVLVNENKMSLNIQKSDKYISICIEDDGKAYFTHLEHIYKLI